jgi:hypothetical protein
MVDFMDHYEQYHNNSVDNNVDDFDTGESNTKEAETPFKHLLETIENGIMTKYLRGHKTPLKLAKIKKGKELIKGII